MVQVGSLRVLACQSRCDVLEAHKQHGLNSSLFSGKSTLLQVLAGQHMVGPDVVRILGRPAFHDVVRSLCFASAARCPSYARQLNCLVLAATDVIR